MRKTMMAASAAALMLGASGVEAATLIDNHIYQIDGSDLISTGGDSYTLTAPLTAWMLTFSYVYDGANQYRIDHLYFTPQQDGEVTIFVRAIDYAFDLSGGVTYDAIALLPSGKPRFLDVNPYGIYTNYRPSAQLTFEGAVLTRTAEIPEPATWAVMVLGFGLVGSALRRRPKRA